MVSWCGIADRLDAAGPAPTMRYPILRERLSLKAVHPAFGSRRPEVVASVGDPKHGGTGPLRPPGARLRRTASEAWRGCGAVGRIVGMPTNLSFQTILGDVVGSTAHRYALTDSAGNTMDTVKIITNPAGRLPRRLPHR
jgi:hypothetical protein